MQFHVYLDIFIAMIIYLFELDILTWSSMINTYIFIMQTCI